LRHSCCLMHWLQLRYDFDLIVTSVDAPSDIQCHSTVNGVAKSNQSHNIAVTTVWMLFLLFSVSEWCFSCFVLLNWFAAVVLSDDIITHWCWCSSLFFVRQHTQHTERDIVSLFLSVCLYNASIVSRRIQSVILFNYFCLSVCTMPVLCLDEYRAWYCLTISVCLSVQCQYCV